MQLRIPKVWYYLSDGSYSSARRLLVPYKNTRYHYQEGREATLRPETKEELFNHRHTLLRDIGECSIGNIKGSFRIFRLTPHFSVPTQNRIIIAAAAIHNFLY